MFTHFLLEGLLGAASRRINEGDREVSEIVLLSLCNYVVTEVDDYTTKKHKCSQQPKLSAFEIGNESLGVLPGPPKPSPKVGSTATGQPEGSVDVNSPGKKPSARQIDEDFTSTPDGELPENWVAPSGAFRVERKDGQPRLVVAQGGMQKITLPQTAVQGDFELECEFRIVGGYGKSPAIAINLERAGGKMIGVGALINGGKFVVVASGMPDASKDNWPRYMPERARMRISRKADVVNVFVGEELFQTLTVPNSIHRIWLALAKGTEVYSIKIDVESAPRG